MKPTPQYIRETIEILLPETRDLLCDMIVYRSTPGKEHGLMEYLYDRSSSLNCLADKIPMTDSLKDDPDYSDPVPGIVYDGRYNLRLLRTGGGGGRTLLFNAHTDVVPASEGMAEAFRPRVLNDTVYGRGACDDKGQIALLYLVLRALDSMGVTLKGDLIAHLVCEEENGGNGSLAMIRHGEKADGCIVLEPTEQDKVLTSIRGAVWFRIDFKGTAGHSGQPGATRSALLLARKAMDLLEDYHRKLLDESRGFTLFDPYPNPMPITFGRLAAGNWPASAPNQATLEGVLGFLPNRTKEEVCREIEEALTSGGLSPESFDLHFMYRHDCSVVDPEHELPQGLLSAAREMDNNCKVDAMTASCDAWFYNNQLGIPTVVYGAGSLSWAHTKDEQIRLADIATAAGNLVQFILNYCG